MKLATKFNLIFTVAFALGLVAAGCLSYLQLQKNAKEQVVANARIMLQTALAMRSYTVNQLQPVFKESWDRLDLFFVKLHVGVEELSKKIVTDDGKDFLEVATRILDAGKSKIKEAKDGVFYPQSVPAYAATENFNYVRKEYPQYTYKEATLNPTNPRDLPVDWEKTIIDELRSNRALTEIIGERMENGEEILYLARPIRIESEACLTCHSTPDVAPAAMVKLYGSDRGFGWMMNDIIGAQIVTVPTSLPNLMAERAFRTLMFSLCGVFIATLIILNIVLRIAVIKPVRRLSQIADTVSKGDLSAPEVHLGGKDEISTLSSSFARMRRSLEKALKMLEP